jgi:hypothetical protein
MEHPLIHNLNELSEDELITKISELNKKLGIAARSGNGHLCNQLRMALESYQNTYQAKLQAAAQKQLSDPSLANKINIE